MKPDGQLALDVIELVYRDVEGVWVDLLIGRQFEEAQDIYGHLQELRNHRLRRSERLEDCLNHLKALNDVDDEPLKPDGQLALDVIKLVLEDLWRVHRDMVMLGEELKGINDHMWWLRDPKVPRSERLRECLQYLSNLHDVDTE
jgi:hypothetical protein